MHGFRINCHGALAVYIPLNTASTTRVAWWPTMVLPLRAFGFAAGLAAAIAALRLIRRRLRTKLEPEAQPGTASTGLTPLSEDELSARISLEEIYQDGLKTACHRDVSESEVKQSVFCVHYE